MDRILHPEWMDQVKAVFFDLDDTLCGYWDAAKAGLRDTFATHPVAEFTPERMHSFWAEAFYEFCPRLRQLGWYERYLKNGGVTRTELMRLTLAKAGVDDPDLAQAMSDTYGEARNRHLRLFPEASAVLDHLHPRFPLGLITNGSADVQRQEIATLDLDRYLAPDRVFIEGEMGEGKPRLSVFERARASVGLEPHEILFVGNSYGHDITPALAAGFQAYWVRRASDVPPSKVGEDARPEERPPDGVEPTIESHDLRALMTL